MTIALQKCLLLTQSGHLPVAEKWSILNRLGTLNGLKFNLWGAYP